MSDNDMDLARARWEDQHPPKCARCGSEIDGTVETLPCTEATGCRPCYLLEMIEDKLRAVEAIAQSQAPNRAAAVALWSAGAVLLDQLTREARGSTQAAEAGDAVEIMERACEDIGRERVAA